MARKTAEVLRTRHRDSFGSVGTLVYLSFHMRRLLTAKNDKIEATTFLILELRGFTIALPERRRPLSLEGTLSMPASRTDENFDSEGGFGLICAVDGSQLF